MVSLRFHLFFLLFILFWDTCVSCVRARCWHVVAWRACLLVLVVGSKTLPAAAISMIGENSEGIPPSCESKFPPTSVKENKKNLY